MQRLLVELRRSLEPSLALLDTFGCGVSTFTCLLVLNPARSAQRIDILLIVVLQRREHEVLRGLREIRLDEEVRVEGAQVQVVVLRHQTLLEEVVGVIVAVEIHEHLRKPHFRYRKVWSFAGR